MENIEVKKLDLKLKEGHAVCFDFDGVIHKYSKGWQDGSIYDEYNKNVLDLMLFLQKLGVPIFICSTREPYQIISWWNKQGFWCEAVRVNDNETFWNELNLIGVTNRKLPAQMYIDDRAYKYTGQTVKQFILDNSEELEEKTMLSEEEKKAIKLIKQYRKEIKDGDIKPIFILDTAINLITKLQKENEEKDKQIDLIIEEYEYNNRINFKNFCEDELRKDSCIQDCKLCAKHYFEKLAKEKEE